MFQMEGGSSVGITASELVRCQNHLTHLGYVYAGAGGKPLSPSRPATNTAMFADIQSSTGPAIQSEGWLGIVTLSGKVAESSPERATSKSGATVGTFMSTARSWKTSLAGRCWQQNKYIISMARKTITGQRIWNYGFVLSQMAYGVMANVIAQHANAQPNRALVA